MTENQLPLSHHNKSDKTKSKRLTLRAKVLIGILLLFLLAIGFYAFYLKDKIIEVSAEKLSEILHADLDFEEYRFLDPGTLEIIGLNIKSPYLKSDYRKVNQFRKDWYSFNIKKITLHGFDYNQFIDNRSFQASYIELDSVEIDVYRDTRLPFPPFKKKLLLASLLGELDYKIHLNTIKLTNANIRYFEKTEHAAEPGMISFINSTVSCQNVTNIPENIIINPTLTCNIQSTVLEEASITGQVLFNLNSKSDKFTVLGSAQSFQAEKLNRIISGVMPISITDGQIHSMNFRIDGNDDRATGQLDMEYDEIKIEIRNKNDNKFKADISTFVANTLTRNQNLSSRKDYKQGQIQFERVKNRSIFNYWWNSLRTGIIDIMMTDTGKLLKLDEKTENN